MERSEQKAETRRRVLTAAARLVERRGFRATRTTDIARASRLSHGALFVHFPSREALDLAVASDIGRAVTDRLHALLSEGKSFREALQAHLRCLEEHEAVYARLLTEGPFLPRGFMRTWTGIQSAVRPWRLPTCARAAGCRSDRSRITRSAIRRRATAATVRGPMDRSRATTKRWRG
jgi:AcrR family transcriptional regulator